MPFFCYYLSGNYLSQQGEAAKDKLVAGMVVSVCWDCFKGTESLERAGLNWMLNRHLANCLVDSIKEVRRVQEFKNYNNYRHIFFSEFHD